MATMLIMPQDWPKRLHEWVAVERGYFDEVGLAYRFRGSPPEWDELRPGGFVHLLLEDYGLLHASPCSPALERFWQDVPRRFGDALGTDMLVGRRGFALLRGAGLEEIAHVDLVVDTLRVPRDVFAGIIEAWRDGFSEALAGHAGLAPDEVRARWEELLAVIRDPAGYAVWRVPIWSGRVPVR